MTNVQKPFKSVANAGQCQASICQAARPLSCLIPYSLQPQLAAKNIKKGDRQQNFVVATGQASVEEGNITERKEGEQQK